MQPHCTTEEWRAIPGFPGYEVSSCGRVRSWLGYMSRWTLKRHPLEKPRLLKLFTHTRGRLYAHLASEGTMHQFPIHRLVLLVFIGPCPEGMEGCHNDGTHLNNHLGNLRWDTRKGNHADRWRHGTMPVGESSTTHKLKESDVIAIRARFANGVNPRLLGQEFDVSRGTILRIAKGQTWPTTTGPRTTRTIRDAVSKLRPTDVVSIRERFASGETYYELAAWFAIGPTTVSNIVNGRTWRDIGGPITHAGKKRIPPRLTH